MTTWSVTGAVAAQSDAHDRLTKAINEGRAVEIWQGDCRITTCASMKAAKAWIGKSKKYTLVQQEPELADEQEHGYAQMIGRSI